MPQTPARRAPIFVYRRFWQSDPVSDGIYWVDQLWFENKAFSIASLQHRLNQLLLNLIVIVESCWSCLSCHALPQQVNDTSVEQRFALFGAI